MFTDYWPASKNNNICNEPKPLTQILLWFQCFLITFGWRWWFFLQSLFMLFKFVHYCFARAMKLSLMSPVLVARIKDPYEMLQWRAVGAPRRSFIILSLEFLLVCFSVEILNQRFIILQLCKSHKELIFSLLARNIGVLTLWCLATMMTMMTMIIFKGRIHVHWNVILSDQNNQE